MNIYLDKNGMGTTITYSNEGKNKQHLYVHDKEGFIIKPLQEKITEIVVGIEKFISRNAEIEIAPHGDFRVIISLAKLNDFFEKIKEGENNE